MKSLMSQPVVYVIYDALLLKQHELFHELFVVTAVVKC